MIGAAGPALPAGPVPGRKTLLHQAVADAVARVARALVLSGDCPTALGAVAGLLRRYRDVAVVCHGTNQLAARSPVITVKPPGVPASG